MIVIQDVLLGAAVEDRLTGKEYEAHQVVFPTTARVELEKFPPDMAVAEDTDFLTACREHLPNDRPLLALYGADTGESRNFCRENGAYLIVKPLDEKKLTKEIVRVIRRQSVLYRFFHKSEPVQ
jgi:DNA-binding response OmpR family regulator